MDNVQVTDGSITEGGDGIELDENINLEDGIDDGLEPDEGSENGEDDFICQITTPEWPNDDDDDDDDDYDYNDGDDDDDDGEPKGDGDPMCSNPEIPVDAGSLITIEVAKRNGPEVPSIVVSSVYLADLVNNALEVELDLDAYKETFKTGWGNMVILITACEDSNEDGRCTDEAEYHTLGEIDVPLFISKKLSRKLRLEVPQSLL